MESRINPLTVENVFEIYPWRGTP